MTTGTRPHYTDARSNETKGTSPARPEAAPAKGDRRPGASPLKPFGLLSSLRPPRRRLPSSPHPPLYTTPVGTTLTTAPRIHRSTTRTRLTGAYSRLAPGPIRRPVAGRKRATKVSNLRPLKRRRRIGGTVAVSPPLLGSAGRRSDWTWDRFLPFSR